MKDPYINENGVLKNKLDIVDYDQLNIAEADIGFLKLINVDSIDVSHFDMKLVQNIHKHIFEDIFDWAGEFRTVPIIKEELVLPGYSIPYSEPKNIKQDLKNKLLELNSIAWQNMDTSEIAFMFARKMALIWKVHPFRDGNTRTILSFSFLYAKEHGFPFDIKTFTNELNRGIDLNGRVTSISIRDKFVLACLDESFSPEVEHLANVFERAINNYNKEDVSSKTK